MEAKQKKNLKWLWIAIAVVVVAAIGVWCGVNASEAKGAESTLKFSNTFVLFALLFIIAALGYLLGSISIKGVSLGTAGVFLVAILVGWLCTLDFGNVALLGKFHVNLFPGLSDIEKALLSEGEKALLAKSEFLVETFGGPIQNIGLMLFVGSVGLIAGPNFFKNLKKNFTTYILLGAVIIIVGALVTVVCVLLTRNSIEDAPEYWAGILSGALTSTPGFSAAKDAATSDTWAKITLGHAIAYPFGVIGVVLFVQLMPKFMKADMNKERQLLKIGGEEGKKSFDGLFTADPFGITPFAIAVACGLLLGSITIPLTGKGYSGACFSLGTTGGVLIMCLVFGHFGRIGKFSLQVPEATLKLFREFGLMLFLLGAGFEGGVSLVSEIAKQNAAAAGGEAMGSGAMVAWGFGGGALMTLIPMVIGFIFAKYVLKLPLLNNLGSITGGMTSTPALGTLIHVAGTEDVAAAYAATYPIALVAVVFVSQFIIILF